MLQVFVLPALSREVGSGFGALHGVNAIVLLGLAYMAGKRASAAIGAPVATGRLLLPLRRRSDGTAPVGGPLAAR